MASSRRGQPSLSVRLPPNASLDLPPIAALFLIDFDVKAGYTIIWKEAAPGVELEGLVEYKSLPSGLHTVSKDLIYFVHDSNYAGLSAFVNMPCDEADARNARMIAVGVLVPLSYGRLGRAWRHAEGLQDMATKLAADRTATSSLDEYWATNKEKTGQSLDKRRRSSAETPISSPAVHFQTPPHGERKGHNRNRSASDGAALVPAGNRLSPYHPAWSLTSLLDYFGPLIFPIHRAALLRKRILISCHAPVHEVCDFVYDISVLSNIPLSVTDILPASASTHRLRPLFTIGVHDIPFLTEDFAASKRPRHNDDEAVEDEAGSGWIACTTDSILAMKDTLWDMLVTLPPDYSTNAKDKVWPTIEYPRGQPIKATQRDLRRFNSLRSGLARLAAAAAPANDSPEPDTEGVRLSNQSRRNIMHDRPDDAVEKIVEPLSWAALAYNGYMWWASAGEKLRAEEQEESARDAALLADLAPSSHSPMSMPRPSSRSDPAPLSDSLSSLVAARRAAEDDDAGARIELAIIAFFHRLTTQILSVAADLAETSDEAYTDEDPETDSVAAEETPLHPSDDEAEATAVRVDSSAVESMGLDVWSDGDAEFVNELMLAYFGRAARIEGKGVEVCGVRVC